MAFSLGKSGTVIVLMICVGPGESNLHLMLSHAITGSASVATRSVLVLSFPRALLTTFHILVAGAQWNHGRVRSHFLAVPVSVRFTRHSLLVS